MTKQTVNTPLKPIKYALKEIITHRFSLILPTKISNSSKVIELEIKHNITPIIKYKVEDDLILVIMQVKTFIQETEEIVMDAETAFVYHAVDLKTFLDHDKENNTWRFIDIRNEALLTALIGISLSTMRGILYEKSLGTILESAPLPIMNPSTFIKSQQSIEEKK